jgi:hydroxypyruvate isomerase
MHRVRTLSAGFLRVARGSRETPRFAANLTMLFGEVDFLDRFAAAARAGFRGVEYLFPYSYPKEALADTLRKNRLEQVLHNMPAGDFARGERGIACLPGRVGEFQDGVGLAIEYAKALGCPQLNCLAGIAPSAVEPERLRETFVANLRFAAALLGQAGIRCLIEPINTRDMPGFYLCHTAQALSIIDEVGSPNLGLQYDAYHMQVMEGDLATTLERNLPRIGHIQIADTPGRHEPGSGEINYPFLFAHLDRIGYRGWVGCEYKPASTTEAGLGWLEPWR